MNDVSILSTENSEFSRILAEKQKLLDDKSELDSKISALDRFIRSTNYMALERISRSLLREQLEAMREYSGILARRIELFSRGFRP